MVSSVEAPLAGSRGAACDTYKIKVRNRNSVSQNRTPDRDGSTA